MVITWGQQYNTGEKPNVIWYTYINRHAGTPDKKQNINVIKVVLVVNLLTFSVLVANQKNWKNPSRGLLNREKTFEISDFKFPNSCATSGHLSVVQQ